MERRRLTRAIAAAIRRAPCSVRELAREAGVPHTTLNRIVAGTLNPTPDVARKLARALRRWADRCGGDAERITQAMRGDP